MHEWGDEWFEKHGQNFNQAINWFWKFTKRWGRIKLYNKEKYGTHRTDLLQFWDGGLHYFFCKSYVRICYPFLYWKIDPIIKFITKWLGIQWLFLHYQFFIWNLGVQIIGKKYPEFIDEFVMDMSATDKIKPGIFGKIDGEKIRSKYWK